MKKSSARDGATALGTLALAAGVKALRRSDSRQTANGDAAPRADAPGDLPSSDMKSVLKRTYAEITNDHVMLVAAGVTFYALLALFPALAAFVSIFGLFTDPATLQSYLAGLEGVLPGGALSLISDQFETLAANGSTSLGLAFAIGLATSLWSANSGVKAIFEALNIAYEETEERGFVRLTLVALAFTLGGLVFVGIALAALIALPVVLENMALGGLFETLVAVLRWPALLAVVAGLIALLYRYGPSRQPPEWRWVSWGSVAAAVLWLVFSGAFSWYAANFGSYDATYGSLGAAIGFMTWIWISTIVVIAGAELNSEMEHQTVADTTTGQDRPIGQRGATMADRAVDGPDRSAKRGGDL